MTEETLFHEALAKPAAERDAFLDAACAGQPELRAAVEALLAAHNDSADLLARPAAVGETVDSVPDADQPQRVSQDSPDVKGEHIPGPASAPQPTTNRYEPHAEAGTVIAGRYTLAEKIGEGGMGEVWVAKQTEPVKRKVALKLIKAGMDSRAVIQRFEQERQALALMDHPHIAKVLDAGLTAYRKPFFAMELVNGLPLTRFCDEAKLGVRERLELFVPICQAVQHAHQKGIVHRDLKPSNILVTIIDGEGVPKVIDFGVAKATSGRLTEESLSTKFGAVIGTFEYMSPEQAGFAGEDTDTRADIYSLGVILYELLTGLRPLDAKRLRKAALTEMIRILKEEEPSKPSTRISTDASAPSLAALRHTEPKKLAALLRGELDWVVMKCLGKQRDRRYETANGLARDIQRYLANEVVEARPPSAGYRLHKFVSRHKGQVVAAGLVLLALLVGIAGTTWGFIREGQANVKLAAKNEELAAERTKVQARYDLAVDAIKTFHTGVSEDFLLKEERFKVLRDRLLNAAADFYAKLSALLGNETDVGSRRALAQSNFELAELTGKVGRLEDALAAHRAVLAARDALAHDSGADAAVKVELGRSLMAVAKLLSSTVKTDEALTTYRRAESVLVDLADSNSEARAALARCRTAIARLLLFKGKNDEALAECMIARADQEALATVAAQSRDNRRDRAATAYELSYILAAIAKLPEAEAEIRGALEIQRKLVGENSTDADYQANLAKYQSLLAWVLEAAGKMAAAEEESRGALQILDRLAEENAAETAFVRRKALGHKDLGNLLLMTGRPAEAVAELRLGLPIMKRLADENPAVTAYRDDLGLFHCILSLALYQAGNPAEGVAEAREAVAIQQKQVEENPTDKVRRDVLAFQWEAVGDACRAAGQPGDAKIAYERAIALLERRVQEEPTNSRHQFALSDATWRRGLALRKLGDTAGAVADVRRALKLCDGLTPTHGLDW
jgi:eukaryotic-like serine/threonine-protein kinase